MMHRSIISAKVSTSATLNTNLFRLFSAEKSPLKGGAHPACLMFLLTTEAAVTEESCREQCSSQPAKVIWPSESQDEALLAACACLPRQPAAAGPTGLRGRGLGLGAGPVLREAMRALGRRDGTLARPRCAG